MKTENGLTSRVRNVLKPVARYSGQTNSISEALYRSAVERFLHSYDAKCWAIKSASRGRIPDRDIGNIAKKFDPQTPAAKPIPFYEMPRVNKASRLVCDFPLRHRASQLMGQKLIAASFCPHDSIYSWRGRGKDQLVSDLEYQLRSKEATHIVVADIKDCFPNINIDAVRQLQVFPSAFFDAAIDGRKMKFWEKGLFKNRSDYIHSQMDMAPPCNIVMGSERAGLSGLLLGSATSNALLAMLFDDLHSQMPDGVILFVYSDNIVVVCRSEDQCSQVQNNLVAYYSHHPAGPLTLEISFAGEATLGFQLLGYQFDWENSQWVIRHSRKNWAGAFQRMLETYSEAEHDGVSLMETLNVLIAGFPCLSAAAVGDLTEIVSEMSR